MDATPSFGVTSNPQTETLHSNFLASRNPLALSETNLYDFENKYLPIRDTPILTFQIYEGAIFKLTIYDHIPQHKTF